MNDVLEKGTQQTNSITWEMNSRVCSKMAPPLGPERGRPKTGSVEFSTEPQPAQSHSRSLKVVRIETRWRTTCVTTKTEAKAL